MATAEAPAAAFRVTPGDLGAAASRFARLADRAQAGLVAAAAALTPAAGMAGRGAGLATWRERYDAVAGAQWAACVAAVGTLAAVGAKLTATGDAYLAGDHAAAPVPPGRPARLRPARAAPAPPAPPPSSTGAGGPPISELLDGLFPGGDTAALRAAAAAWRELARAWASTGLDADAAFRTLLTGGDGATFSAMGAFWARQFDANGNGPLLSAVGWAADVLGSNCARLADLVDDTRGGVLAAAADATRDMAWLDLPASALSRLTAGITELELLVGKGVLASSLVADRISAYDRQLGELTAELSEALAEHLLKVAVVPASDPSVIVEPATTGTQLPDVAELAGLGVTGTRWDSVPGAHPTPDSIHVTAGRIRHILVGDSTGGGHRSGAGLPGKSEFPPGWSDARILAAVLSVARDPATVERPDDTGRFELRGIVEGLSITVVTRSDGYIVTGHATDGPGVVRNPPRRR